MNLILVAVIVSAAIVCDLSVKRIPNSLILVGYILGSAYIIADLGIEFSYLIIVRALWPILALYLFYYLGAVGAGDIKLFSCISIFLPFITSVNTIIASFLGAAAFSWSYLLMRGEFTAKMWEIRKYISLLVDNKQVVAYKTSDNNSKFSFSTFIGFGFMLDVLLEVVI